MAGSRSYGTSLHEDVSHTRSGEWRLARSALLLVSVAVVALVVVSHAATRLSNETLLSMGSQKELERLERDTFESPDSTYAKALAQLHRAKVTQGAAMEAADAWASPAWPQPHQLATARSVLPDLEHRIAADVSKSLAQTVAKEVAKAMASAHESPQQQVQRQKMQQQQQQRAHAQAKLLSEVQQKVSQDASNMSKDKQLLKWVASRVGRKAKRHSLMHTFVEPESSVEPSYINLPFNDPAVMNSKGPSDTYNYWSGDHYHDEQGPANIAIRGRVVDGDRGDAPEAPSLMDPARDKLESQGVNVRENAAGNVLSFKSKQEQKGEMDPGGREGVLNADNHDDLDDEQALNVAGVVTDRVPGLGTKKAYKKAFPLPFYDHEPSTEESNKALAVGHRAVSEKGEHMQNDLGVALTVPNALIYGHTDTHSPHMDEPQAEYTMIDGLGDTMENTNEADEHKPLNNLIDDYKKGSHKLEAAKVNVWGQPLDKMIPEGFFGRETAAMRQTDGSKLKMAGINTNAVSPFPTTAPKVGE